MTSRASKEDAKNMSPIIIRREKIVISYIEKKIRFQCDSLKGSFLSDTNDIIETDLGSNDVHNVEIEKSEENIMPISMDIVKNEKEETESRKQILELNWSIEEKEIFDCANVCRKKGLKTDLWITAFSAQIKEDYFGNNSCIADLHNWFEDWGKKLQLGEVQETKKKSKYFLKFIEKIQKKENVKIRMKILNLKNQILLIHWLQLVRVDQEKPQALVFVYLI